MTTQPQQVWLTQEGYNRLQAELAHLTGDAREAVVRRIEDARSEGDLKENGGYHAAKEEQGKQEARVRQLQQLLRDAKVGEAPSDGTAGLGTIIEVRFSGDTSTERYLLGSREDSGSGVEVLSPQSSIGKNVVGHKAGDVVTYEAPNGRSVSLELVSVTPYSG